MKSQTFLLLPALVGSALAACDAGVHIIVARASNEAAGQGIIGAVARNISSQIPGSSITAVDYPATLLNYTFSEPAGVVAMNKLVAEYTASCPTSKMVLMGYSQGAQVVGDVVCGTTEMFFNATSALPTASQSQILAIIQMGDPAHVVGLTGNVGNATKNGIFVGTKNSTTCQDFLRGKTQAYCDEDDFFCAGGKSIPVHVGYVREYGAQAAAYVVGKWTALGNASNSTAGTSSSASATSSSTSATSSAASVSATGTTTPSVSATTPASTTSSAPARVTGGNAGAKNAVNGGLAVAAVIVAML